MTLRRMRQATAAVLERRKRQSLERWQELRWQTRTICQYVAATIELPEGSENQLLKLAESIGEETLEVDEAFDEEELDRIRQEQG